MNFFGEIALPIVLFIIMVGIGLSTRISDFKALIKYPKATIVGVVSQIILLPIIALFLAWIFNFDEAVTLGLLLLSLCPSGTGSNIITKMVRGNLALSVSLTTVSNFKSLVTIPIILNWFIANADGLAGDVQLDYIDMTIRVFALTIIPTALGVFIGEKWSFIVESTKKTLKWLLPGLLFGVFTAIMFFDEPKSQGVDITEMIIPAIIINLASMFGSLIFAKLFKVENKQAIAIGIEGGLKNSAIGLMIATTFLHVGTVELLILAYSFISFYLTFVMSFLIRKVLV